MTHSYNMFDYCRVCETEGRPREWHHIARDHRHGAAGVTQLMNGYTPSSLLPTASAAHSGRPSSRRSSLARTSTHSLSAPSLNRQPSQRSLRSHRSRSRSRSISPQPAPPLNISSYSSSGAPPAGASQHAGPASGRSRSPSPAGGRHLLYTSRLLIRSVKIMELQQYGIINSLALNQESLFETIQEWNDREAIRLFLISRGIPGAPVGLSVPEGTVVSFIQILREGDNGKSEISFRTHPSAQRQGYMTETLTRVFDYAFNELGR